MANFHLSGLRVLQFGFGEGRFLSWATSQGAQCTGFELIPTLAEKGISFGLDVIIGFVEDAKGFDAEGFDLIIAFDVREQVTR